MKGQALTVVALISMLGCTATVVDQPQVTADPQIEVQQTQEPRMTPGVLHATPSPTPFPVYEFSDRQITEDEAVAVLMGYIEQEGWEVLQVVDALVMRFPVDGQGDVYTVSIYYYIELANYIAPVLRMTILNMDGTPARSDGPIISAASGPEWRKASRAFKVENRINEEAYEFLVLAGQTVQQVMAWASQSQ